MEKGFLNFAQKSLSSILHIQISAINSSLFCGCSMVYKPLAGIMLAHEIFNKQAQIIAMRVYRIVN